MTTLVDLVFKASTSELDKAQDTLKKVQREAKGANSESTLLSDAFEGMSSTARLGAAAVLGVGAAAVTAAGAILTLATNTALALDKFNDLSDRTNIAVDRLQLLDAKARMVGLTVEDLTGGAERLASKLAKQDEESGKAAIAIEQLGIKTKTASGEQKSALAIQEEIIRAAANATDKATAEGLAVSALGNDYYKLRGAYKDTQEEAGKFYDRMRDIGVLMSPAQQKEISDFNDKIDNLKQSFSGMAQSITNAVMPAMNWILDKIITLSDAAAAVVRRWLNPSMVDKARDEDAWAREAVARKEQQLRALQDSPLSGFDFTKDAIARAKLQFDVLKEHASLTGRELARALQLEQQVKQETTQGKPDEGPRVTPGSGKPTKVSATDPTSTAAYKEAMRVAQERQQARIKESSDIQKFFADEAEAKNRSYRESMRMVEAEELRAKAAEQSVAENRIQIQVLSKFGATQNDVTLALLDYDIAQAQAMLTTETATNADSDRVRVLQKKLEVLQRIKGAEATKQSDNDADAERQNTFENGWARSFNEYKKQATAAAQTGADVFKAASGHMESALTSFITTGKLNFKQFAASILADIAQIMAKKAIAGLVGSMFGGGYANGAAFEGGVKYFANGDVFNTPTSFGMAGGRRGVLGEAGPEAIMPLTRGADGKLGVKANGSQSAAGTTVIQNHMHVTIGSVDSEERKQELLKALHQQMVATAKATMAGELRQGGMLNRRLQTA